MMHNTDKRKVLIVGGGIGGVATLIGLRRAGVDALLFERAGDWSQVQVGGGMDIQVNAMRAFKALGVDQEVEAIGHLMERQELRTSAGDLLAVWPYDEVAQRFGVHDVRVTRTRLHRVLTQAAGEDAIRLGTQAVGFSQDPDGVTLRFADGSEERGDALIGADGLNSVIRSELLGRSEPRYAGYGYWRGYTTIGHPQVSPRTATMYFGCGAMCATYALGSEQVAWFSASNAPQGDTSVGKRELMARHKGWAGPIRELIDATDESVITKTDIVDRDPVDRWGEGRVTLLGDAAHAMTTNLAQGACQAVEDAVVLARCLSRNDDVVAALREYEARRIPRTTDVVLRSRSAGQIFASTNKLLFTLRTYFLRLGGNRRVVQQYVKDMSYEF